MPFESIPSCPEDPIFGLNAEFQLDQRETKHNFVMGICKDENQETALFPTVKQVAQDVVSDLTNFSYLPVNGDASFCKEIAKLIGIESEGVQTLGGTGALYLASRFVKRQGYSEIVVGIPTWVNHRRIFEDAGLNIRYFELFDNNKRVRYDHWLDMARESQEPLLFLMQACCYNPLGVDMTREEWDSFAQICEEKGHFIIFDMAYHGMKESLEADSYGVNLWNKKGLPSFICYSCSKNFGLYSLRTGALFPLGCMPEFQEAFKKMASYLIRPIYSNPPSLGAHIVERILSQPFLKVQWREELDQFRKELIKKRLLLTDALKSSQLDWSFIEGQSGLFALLNLNPHQIRKLKEQYGIYLAPMGRMNVSALHSKNIEFITRSILEVVG